MSIPAPVIPVPVAQFFDDNGHALAGGFLLSYLAGSNTPYPTYSDAALTQPNALNCPLDSSGRPTSGAIYLAAVVYKFDLQDKHGISMRGYPRDNIGDYGQLLGANLSGTTGASFINYNEGGAGAVTRTVQSRLQDRLSVKDFGATGNGVTDDTVAVQAAITAAGALGGAIVFFPAGTYLCNTTQVLSTSPTVTMVLGVLADNITLQGAPGSLLKHTASADVFLVVDGAAKASGGWNNTWIPFTWAKTTPLYVISTAASGDKSVTCTTVAQAGNFAPGDYIFIKTGELLGVLDGSTNEPDSEVNQVVSANASTGVIVLRWPLSKPYAQENYVAGSTGVTIVGGGGTQAPFGVAKVTANTLQNFAIDGLQFDVTCGSGVFSIGRAIGVRVTNTRMIGDAIISNSGNYRHGIFANNIVHSRGINLPAGVSAAWWFSTATGTTDAKILNNVCSAATLAAFMHLHEGSAIVDLIGNTIMNPPDAVGVFPAVNIAARAYGHKIINNTGINAGQFSWINVQTVCVGPGIIAGNRLAGGPYSAAGTIPSGFPAGWVIMDNIIDGLNGEVDFTAAAFKFNGPVTLSALTLLNSVNPTILLNDTGAGVPSIGFDLNSVFKTSIALDRTNTRLAVDLADYGVYLGAGQISTLNGGKLGFYQKTPIVQAILATGAGHSVDDVITALQNLGLVRQS